MLRALRKRWFGMLFGIITGLMVSLTVAPVRAADFDLPTDAKIQHALKVKRLTRCLQTHTRCGGARLQNLHPKGPAIDVEITFGYGSRSTRHGFYRK
jgi:hypothetical protein